MTRRWTIELGAFLNFDFCLVEVVAGIVYRKFLIAGSGDLISKQHEGTLLGTLFNAAMSKLKAATTTFINYIV